MIIAIKKIKRVLISRKQLKIIEIISRLEFQIRGRIFLAIGFRFHNPLLEEEYQLIRGIFGKSLGDLGLHIRQSRVIGKRIKSFIEVKLESKSVTPVVLIAQTHHNIVVLEKRMGVIKVLQNISTPVVLFLEPVRHFRVFTLLLIDYHISFDDNSLSTN